MTEPSFIVMIPARYGSTRLPGKPMAEARGKPLIEQVVRQALMAGATRVIVVTDNNDVATIAENTGAEVMTFTGEYEAGTDRLAAACGMLELADHQLVVNVPCDMPMLDPTLLGLLARDFAGSFCEVGTLGEIVEPQQLHTLSDPAKVKLVTDDGDRALFFSRSVIPFDRNQASIKNPVLNELYLRHIGIYAYRVATIKELAEAGKSPLEEMEDIEALRPLSYGLSVSVLTVHSTDCFSIYSPTVLARYSEGITDVA